MSDAYDRIQRLFAEAIERRDKPAAEAALAAMKATLDQEQAQQDEAALATVEDGTAQAEMYLRAMSTRIQDVEWLPPADPGNR